jgi:hypothetical protein
MNFVAELGSSKIGFECDGAEFHEYRNWRDQWRDAAILGTWTVHAIYRLPGRVLTYCVADCLTVVAKLDPELFSHRGITNLDLLASEPARRLLEDEDRDRDSLHLIFCARDFSYIEMVHEVGIEVERRTLDNRELRARVDYINAHARGNLDSLVQAWRDEREP